MSGIHGWTDPSAPPVEGCVDLGSNVWACWAEGWARPGADGVVKPLIWHWCDRSVAKTRDSDRLPEWYEPQWVAGGTMAHDLVAVEPLHIEPSFLMPACCGIHGFIRNGRWVSA